MSFSDHFLTLVDFVFVGPATEMFFYSNENLYVIFRKLLRYRYKCVLPSAVQKNPFFYIFIFSKINKMIVKLELRKLPFLKVNHCCRKNLLRLSLYLKII